MYKSDFIAAVANRILKKDGDVKAVIDAALTIISEQLAAGEPVTLQGFGTFEVREHAATTARNPRTGEAVTVPAKRVPAFKPAKSLKETVEK